MYNVKSMKAEEFIDNGEIMETLAYAEANKSNAELLDAIMARAELRQGLSHREASVLLACEDKERQEKLCPACRRELEEDRCIRCGGALEQVNSNFDEKRFEELKEHGVC